MQSIERLVDRIAEPEKTNEKNVIPLAAQEPEPADTEEESDTDEVLLDLVHRRRELRRELAELEERQQELTDDLEALDDHILHLTGIGKPAAPAAPAILIAQTGTGKRTVICKACGKPGHRSRGKLSDGRLFCPENPEGKPLEELNGQG